MASIKSYPSFRHFTHLPRVDPSKMTPEAVREISQNAADHNWAWSSNIAKECLMPQGLKFPLSTLNKHHILNLKCVENVYKKGMQILMRR